MKIKVSIVILNWNGIGHLKKCLESIQFVTYSPLEVIVVDNASTDGSVEMVKKEYPKVIVVENKKNMGYCGGNNLGIKKSTGKYVFILNNDTEVTKNFLEELVFQMEKDKKIGCIQPKIVYGADHSMLNAVGSYLTSTGFLYHYGYRKKSNSLQYNTYMPIYSAKGAAMLFRREALDKVGLFDEDFFIFFEETDLCHRLWLSGYTVMYDPKSLIYHYEAVDTSSQMRNFTRTYLSFKNRICSYIKNLESVHAIKMLSALGLMYSILFFFYLLKLKLDQSSAIIMSVVWNISNLQNTLAKRKYIQSKLRKKSDRVLFPIIKKDPAFSYYVHAFSKDLKDYPYESII